MLLFLQASVSLERLRAPLESQEMFALPQTIVAMESLQLLAELLRSHLLPAAEASAPAAAPRVRALVEQADPSQGMNQVVRERRSNQ